MWYIIIAGCLLIGLFFTTKFRSCNTPGQQSNTNHSIIAQGNENDTIKDMFSRQQIDQKLKHLAETPAPKNLSFGAECYEKVFREYNVYEYSCPVCGEKTVYKNDQNNNNYDLMETLDLNLNRCRIEIEKVKGINIKLDEKEFCEHCSPKLSNPKMYLLINIAGQKDTTKISNFYYWDIRLIQEFLDDKLIHKDDQDSESPLKDNIIRIKELLGIK
jgi:predicted RNA-binding Zn-ribbon protein involved in translation (DUF1610 family)